MEKVETTINMKNYACINLILGKERISVHNIDDKLRIEDN